MLTYVRLLTINFILFSKSYPEATETMTEMNQLKLLWDFHSYCDSNYEEWGLLLWNDIDTELLAGKNKVIMKALRKFTNENPVVKAWSSCKTNFFFLFLKILSFFANFPKKLKNIFFYFFCLDTSLEQKVKEMDATLPLVEELHSRAM